MHDVGRFDRWAPTYDRHFLQRWVFEPVQKTVLELAAAESPSPIAILDVGCGTGRLLRAAETVFPGATMEGVDAAAGMVRQARSAVASGSRIRIQQAAAEKLPFADAQFDLVFSTLTFHHWVDQLQGIREVARVLKPSGRWLLADFLPSGVMKYVRAALRMKQFPVRGELDAVLSASGLMVAKERQVAGLRGQVRVLAIGRRL